MAETSTASDDFVPVTASAVTAVMAAVLPVSYGMGGP